MYLTPSSFCTEMDLRVYPLDCSKHGMLSLLQFTFYLTHFESSQSLKRQRHRVSHGITIENVEAETITISRAPCSMTSDDQYSSEMALVSHFAFLTNDGHPS